MDLTHRFTVPATVEETWAAFNDIESVAGCFPGAVVTEVSGDDFKGTCKVKLGPIALVYTGVGTFVEKDETAKKFVVEAKGKDKRGNGTAGATVVAQLTASGTSTDVEVVTDLSITGKPAQFGRGVIQDVSDKLLGQFVACLEQKVGAEPAPEAATTGPSDPVTAPGDAASTPLPVPPPADGEVAGPAAAPPPASTPVASPVATTPRHVRAAPEPRAASGGDALDLGATVLPILAKAYWKQGVGAGAVLAFLVWLVRRR